MTTSYTDWEGSVHAGTAVSGCISEGTDEVLKLKIAAGVLGREYAAFR